MGGGVGVQSNKCRGQMFVGLKRYSKNKKLFQQPALNAVCWDVSVEAARRGAVNGERERDDEGGEVRRLDVNT